MMNNLFVAQAAKEQADKQLLLASAQSVQLASLTFAGCNQGNYPSMFGTATILVAGNSAFKLDSGYSVLIGGCTTKRKGDYTNGTVIVFEGYLKGGAIHAIRLSNG